LRFTRLSLLIISLALALSASASSAATSANEPFFPHAGNPGYDVATYEVHLDYSRSGRVEAKATIGAWVTETRKSFSFDFLGPRVTRVQVAESSTGVSFRRNHGKLIVLFDRPIQRNDLLWVDVFYSGVPPTITDPDGTKEGWYRTDDGALAVGEPQGTAAWLPCNNVPYDKASFSIDITVPAGLKAISNGGLSEIERRGGRTTYSWEEGRRMSPYLAVVDIGRGRLYKSGVDGQRGWTLVDPRLQERSRPVLASLSEIVRFESGLYGPYPFPTAGSIVDYAPRLGYALETQSRPIYPYVPDLTTVVHETAHQWFGDSVGLKRWPEIWLNEGFATWTEWYYAERHGRRSAHAIFNRLYRVPASNEEFWNPPSAHPGSAKNLFGPSVYIRGAMALEALRLKIGTRPMLRVLREWATGHRYGSGTIEEFEILAEEISGRPLGRFFQRWLYQRGKP
jgi:aminopeptidase N